MDETLSSWLIGVAGGLGIGCLFGWNLGISWAFRRASEYIENLKEDFEHWGLDCPHCDGPCELAHHKKHKEERIER